MFAASAAAPAMLDIAADPLRERLQALDLDALSPREAHLLLEELQREAREKS